MAKAVPLVAAVAGTVVTGGGLGAAIGLSGFFATAANSLAGFVVSTAVSQVGSRALGKKPKGQSFTSEAAGRTVTVRSAVESHKVVYGTARVSGPLAHAATSSSLASAGNASPAANKYLHLVIPLAGHEIDAVTQVYFNDQPVTLDGSGNVTSAPYQVTTATTSEQAVGPVAVSAVTRAAFVPTPTATFTAATAAPHGFVPGDRVVLAGTASTHDGTQVVAATPTASTFTFVRSVSGSPVTATGGTARATRVVTTTTAGSYARVRAFLGSPDQPADPAMVLDVPGWTAAHRGRGIAYLYVRLEYHPDVFPTGIPNVSAVVRGKKVYDPRSGLTAWSANAALCARDFLASDYGFACAAAELDDAYFSAAATVCDESVTLNDASTQARYTCNGPADTAKAPLDTVQELLSACAGAVTYVQGKFRLHAGAYDLPAGTLTPDHLAGAVRMAKGVTRKEAFNAVKGTYVDPLKGWQPTDFPAVTNATYQAQDGGERVFKDVELPFTTHPEAAQRIAKLLLEKARQGITVELPLSHAAMKYSAFDTLAVDNPQLGWGGKVFRVLKAGTTGTGPVVLSLQEESAASYDWNSGEATTADPAPDTTLPDAFTVQPPGVPAVAEEKYATRTGAGVKVKAVVTWGPSADAFVSGYQAEYRPAGTAAWAVFATTADTAADIADVSPGRYEFRVKAVNTLGVSSAYSAATTAEIVGLSDAPAAIQNLTVQAVSGLAVLQWTLPADLDVTEGGRILIRHSEALTGAAWEQSYTLGDPVPGAQPFALLPLVQGTYLLKAEDSSGVQSTVATASTKNASVLAFTTLTTVQEDSTFTGAHSSTVAAGGALKLAGALNLDDMPSFDAIGTLDATGGTASSGTYTFASGIDLGSVKRCRLEASLALTAVNVTDRVDTRTGLLDDWLDFDGPAAGGSVDAWVEARATDDDPAGTPTWGAWNRLAAADQTARAFQFRCRLRSTDPAYNPTLTRLRVTAKEVT